MDIATILGLVISFMMIVLALSLGEGNTHNVSMFLSLPSFLIVVGGTFGATLTQYSFSKMLHIGKIICKTIFGKKFYPKIVISAFVELAAKAKQDGIKTIAPLANNQPDPFVRKGLLLVVEGIEPETISDILESEIEHTRERHEVSISLLESMATYAPALGLTGTVIGLVRMLNNMKDPSQIGPDMAVALITTFYGVILANLFFLPLAGKLRLKSREEQLMMEMEMEGIIALAQGENPRVLHDKLTAFQAPKDRTVVE